MTKSVKENEIILVQKESIKSIEGIEEVLIQVLCSPTWWEGGCAVETMQQNRAKAVRVLTSMRLARRGGCKQGRSRAESGRVAIFNNVLERILLNLIPENSSSFFYFYYIY